MKKILVTGAKGFVGKNLCLSLKNSEKYEVMEYDVDTEESLLEEFIMQADFLVHLAGVNRPKEDKEFETGNHGFTSQIIDMLEKRDKRTSIIFSSSIHAEKDNPYGTSKRNAEQVIFDYGRRNNAEVFVYRLPNLFGKCCRPNYNSVIATFCHNIARDLPITVNDPNYVMNVAYIDDVVDEFINAIEGRANIKGDGFCYVPITYTRALGEIAILIQSFKESRKNLLVPNMDDELCKKLYSTYLSYLKEDDFSYPLKMNVDHRGAFTEFLKTPERGQVSVNVSKPGIVKGNHWHHTKNEKFLVVSGEAVIRFRKIGEKDIIEVRVSDKELRVVDIPPGYTHSIENVGQTDLVTIMWANECFDPERPDTYYEEV